MINHSNSEGEERMSSRHIQLKAQKPLLSCSAARAGTVVQETNKNSDKKKERH